MLTPICLITLASLLGCHAKADEPEHRAPQKVHCVAPENQSIVDLRNLRGTVVAAPDRDAIVSSQVAGRLLRVRVREGDVVAAGAIVAEVEARPFSSALNQSEAQLAQARALREAAAATAAREAHLVESGLSSTQALENAKSSLAQANAGVAVASAQVDAARQGVERTVVRAPNAGVVVRLLRRVGEVVDGTTATSIVEIADPSTIELLASAPASDILLVQPGQHATITFAAFPGKSFEGLVRTISPAIDPQSGVGTVHLTLLPGDTHPPIGLLGQAAIIVGAPRTALVVPAAALRNGGGTSTEVVACVNGKASVRVVETGVRRDGGVEVVHGLDLQSKVVVDHVVGIEDGLELEDTP